MPSVIHFAKVNVGFDESRLRFVVAESWTGVEAANDIHGPLNQLNGSIQSSRHFLELIPLQQFRQRALWTLLLFLRRCHGPFGHAFRDDLLSQSILRVERSKLYQQAFPQVARAHAKWVEFLNRGYGFFNVFQRVVAILGNFLERNREVAVFIEITDDNVSDLTHGLVTNRDT